MEIEKTQSGEQNLKKNKSNAQQDDSITFPESLRSRTSLKIVHVTDYHMKEQYAEKLKLWFLQKSDRDIDAVIMTGDFDTLKIYSKDPDHPEYPLSESRISSFLRYLEFFASPIYYVPGNHDPASMFFKNKELQGLTPFSFNLHKETMQVAKGLFFAGIGGSCPAEKIQVKRKAGEKAKDMELIWEGFPYATDDESKFDIKLLDKGLSELGKAHEDPSVLLLTHNGPYFSSTCVCSYDGNEKILTGSRQIEKLILKHRDKIFLNMHGHCHSGRGLCKGKSFCG